MRILGILLLGIVRPASAKASAGKPAVTLPAAVTDTRRPGNSGNPSDTGRDSGRSVRRAQAQE
jgi:hypothetical protein